MLLEALACIKDMKLSSMLKNNNYFNFISLKNNDDLFSHINKDLILLEESYFSQSWEEVVYSLSLDAFIGTLVIITDRAPKIDLTHKLNQIVFVEIKDFDKLIWDILENIYKTNILSKEILELLSWSLINEEDLDKRIATFDKHQSILKKVTELVSNSKVSI